MTKRKEAQNDRVRGQPGQEKRQRTLQKTYSSPSEVLKKELIKRKCIPFALGSVLFPA